ncbi:putative N-acetylmannosaminyltransferase [Clostridium saccharobutylicum]|uniref:WecB/TagA/CpsF family glycosyltransferase n=1 Tax=Clostridium saccharobutylicum TaxID=169679 RepID=UPI000983F5FE|nr:WecB/TagA/CpsF family glycosyltransferase [Clostridium saccharobutylicum]AQS11980.1 putative N-acetylmannosaminyltransferase [Clostridium saccharobutylicum]MBC2435678.1 WecB/TagA/CpsF family glycosyltransferase [Clostridium saccharobutylicum]NSB87088.1 exopolysaccharide biosynthesis WecB/TagA/CpsF family protein [Clostridium saccharobutylicum]NYC30005.1 exopolysaccharide biosynthesis WecB/TagA/CpsF family protein [Clostridium saccharobutylicum]OOM18678.1 putative N-acetylmannosaminyltransfe
MSRIKFLNTEIDNVTMLEAINKIDEFVSKRKPSYVVTPNVDHIVKLEVDEEFKEVYRKADLILTDGMPLIWISNFKSMPIKEKISGSDFFPEVCKLASEKGYKIFLLGAAEGVAAKAAENLKNKFEGLNIVGTYSPSYGFEDKQEEIEKIIDIITKSKPDILAVGLGAPKQEKFIHKFRDRLNIPVSLAIGASIDFEAGNIQRAPIFMQKCGLEWFYRLCKEPKRMFKRYLVDDLKIFKIALKYK